MNTTIDLKTAKTIEAMNQKINHIEIYYSFVGKVDLPE